MLTPVGKDGDPIPFVPDFTGAASVQYDFNFAGASDGFFRADWHYVGSSQTQFNQDGLFFNTQESYDVLDLRMAVRKNKWEAVLFLENVFDERAQLRVEEGRSSPLRFAPNVPRTIGVSLQYTSD